METTANRRNKLDVVDNPLLHSASSASKADVNCLKRREQEIQTYLTAYVYPILLGAIVHLLYVGANDTKQGTYRSYSFYFRLIVQFTWISHSIGIPSAHTVLHEYLIEKKEGLEKSSELVRRNKQQNDGSNNVKDKTFMDLKIYPVITKVYS